MCIAISILICFESVLTRVSVKVNQSIYVMILVYVLWSDFRRTLNCVAENNIDLEDFKINQIRFFIIIIIFRD